MTTTPEVIDIPIADISIEEQQLRYNPESDSIIELANDIAKRGLMQPIGVQKKAKGKYLLLWGGRRLAAHKRLGLPTILARIWTRNDEPVKALALVENIQREDLSLAEECDAIAYLHLNEGRSPDQISDLLSKSRSWVMRRLAIPNLPNELKDPVLEGSLAIGSAEEIALLDDEGARRAIAQHTISTKAGISEVRAMVAAYKATPSITEAVEAGVAAAGSQTAPAPIVIICGNCGTADVQSNMMLVWLHRQCPPQEKSIQ